MSCDMNRDDQDERDDLFLPRTDNPEYKAAEIGLASNSEWPWQSRMALIIQAGSDRLIQDDYESFNCHLTLFTNIGESRPSAYSGSH